jgi:hypothetical protein
MPQQNGCGIDVEIAAQGLRRQEPTNFAGSVESVLPRIPPGVPRLGRRQVQQSRMRLISVELQGLRVV